MKLITNIMDTNDRIKRSREAVDVIKQTLNDDVIKDFTTQLLVNIKTGKPTGHAVVLRVAIKYDYAGDLLEHWKEIIGADGWNIYAWRNQLFIRYFIHYKH